MRSSSENTSVLMPFNPVLGLRVDGVELHALQWTV